MEQNTQPPKTNKHLPKLNEEDVKKIRKLHSIDNFSLTKLGAMFNVSHTTIYKIVNRQTWKYIS